MRFEFALSHFSSQLVELLSAKKKNKFKIKYKVSSTKKLQSFIWRPVNAPEVSFWINLN